MTIFEWQAAQIEGAAAQLACAIEHTSADKLDWKPSACEESKTRSALDQAAECIGINRRFASLLRGEPLPPRPTERPFQTGEEAVEMVRSSAAELAAVVRGLDDEALERGFTTPMGERAGKFIIQMPSANMSYHYGQISYIQTLYGDTEFYRPE